MQINEDGTILFDSENEMRSEMYGEHSKEVVAAVLADKAIIGGSVVEDQPEEDTVATEDNVEDTVVVEEEEDISLTLEEQNRQIRERYEQELAAKEAEQAQQLAELTRKLQEFEERERKQAVESSDSLAVELDEEDEELASTYSRNTRKLVEAQVNKLKEMIQTPDVVNQLNELKEQLAQEQKRAEDERKAAEAERKRKELYEDLDKFAKGKKELEMPKSVAEARDEQNEFKDKMAAALGLSNEKDIERTYRKIIREDSAWARAQREQLSLANVSIPEYSSNYLNIVEVYELQRGVKFNTTLGTYEDVSFSLEDVYKLRNFEKLLSKAGETEARELQKKLNEVQGGPVTLDNSVTASASGDVAYTEDDIIAATRVGPSTLVKNTALAQRYKKYLTDNGMHVPTILKNI